MNTTKEDAYENTRRTVVTTLLTTVIALVVTGAYYGLYQAVQNYTVS